MAIAILGVGVLSLPVSGASGGPSFAKLPFRGIHPSSTALALYLGAKHALPDAVSPAGSSYLVFFNETTRPGGKGFSSWAVQFGGDYTRGFGSAIAFSMSNGTYSFEIIPVSGYLPSPASGTVTVAGANQTVQIVFQPAPVYPLRFQESGLPAGDFWYVTMLGISTASNSSNQTYLVSNGTYAFYLGPGYGRNGSSMYRATPSNGTVVINGTGANVSLTFSGQEYMLTFNETGLPAGSSFSACVTNLTPGNPCTLLGGSPPIVTWVPNGTYGFTIEPMIGFTETPATGSVTIAGASVNTMISFRHTNPWQYAVVFNETGLPPSANWTVTVNGTATATTESDLIVGEPNGTYKFSIPAVTSSSTVYNATPSGGKVTVAGGSVLVKIAFSNNNTANASSLRILLFQVSPADITLGQRATFSVTTSGGTGPLTYIYSGVPAGCTAADRASWSCIPVSVGTSRLVVQVRDASGAASSAEVTLVVHSGTPNGPAFSTTYGSAIGIGLVVILGLAAAIVMWIRRGREAASTGSDEENPYRVTDLAFGASPSEEVGLPAPGVPSAASPAEDPLDDLA
ncbi:MAG TPA: hypothetical protein VGX00_01960 [Thermoplasmata archaeon]|nr:hypothetical protein [Thermoplasmata archaeon]